MAAMANESVKVRIMMISDTHGTDVFREGFPKVDVLIHCGDLTTVGLLPEFESTLKTLAKFDAELKLVIAGNHDIALDGEYYARMGREVHGDDFRPTMPQEALRLMNGRKAWQAGVTYLHEGVHHFTLQNGATFTVYATPFQPGFCDWAFPYLGNKEDRFNPSVRATKYTESIAINPIPNSPMIDIMITHGPPLGHLDRMPNGGFLGCRSLQRALARAMPRLHCFGHIHEGRGAERVTWSGTLPEYDTELSVKDREPIDAEACTQNGYSFVDISNDSDHPLQFGKESLLINAAILDGHNDPSFEPWIVDLELPKG